MLIVQPLDFILNVIPTSEKITTKQSYFLCPVYFIHDRGLHVRFDFCRSAVLSKVFYILVSTLLTVYFGKLSSGQSANFSNLLQKCDLRALGHGK